MAKASDFEGKKQDELFYFVDYSPEEAERVGYSNYSYWGSVIQNFLKHKAAVVCLFLFLFRHLLLHRTGHRQVRLSDAGDGFLSGLPEAQQRILVRHR